MLEEVQATAYRKSDRRVLALSNVCRLLEGLQKLFYI